jgi:hypothetical protein
LKAALEREARERQRQQQEIERLRAELDQERERLRVEINRLSADSEAARQEARTTPVVRVGRFGVSLTGFLQADAVAWRQSSQDEINFSTGDPLNETRFLIRRARVRVDLDYGPVAGLIEFDGNTLRGATARLIGAEASLRWRGRDPLRTFLLVALGQFKTPFGFEVPQSDRDRHFLERSTIMRALFPGEYDLGARQQGSWLFLRGTAAVMNGHPLGERQFPGRDPLAAKDFVGRLGVDTTVIGPLALAGGVSGVYGTGFHRGTPPTKDVLVWRDTNDNGLVDASEIQGIPGTAATPSQTFHRFAVGGDLRLMLAVPWLGMLMVYSEVIVATNLDRGIQPADPVSAGRDLRELGWYVGLTQELGRFFMVGARYDLYNPDRDATDLRAGTLVPSDPTFTTLALAASLRFPPLGRLVVQYDHNTNALGRDRSGRPTTLADDALTFRGEVTF